MTAAPPDGLPARRIAFAVLNDVFIRRKSMDESYVRLAGEMAMLEPRDRGFVRLLVSTVLKRQPQMDAALEKLLREPLAAMKPQQLVNVFRLGIAQLSFLETPPHAAVNTAVALAEAEGIAHQKPLVNAVMRRLAEAGIDKLDARDAGRVNTPEWLWQTWLRDYGVETALDIAAANLNEAPVDFTVRGDARAWAEKLGAQYLPTGSLRMQAAGFVPGLPGFDDGAWWVQNAAAALPVKFLGDVRGKSVVDLCAAPGGKTAQLAAAGARVTAIDRSPQRMARLRENLQRLKCDNVETVVADSAVWQPAEKVDAVLLDAPCTATGTIRHQPDVLHLKDARDQEKMAALQKRLMENAVKMLKPGGVLVFCTCSIQKAEGEYQTDSLAVQNLPVVLSPIRAEELDGIAEMLTPRGELRALPHHWAAWGGIDGFYAARFIRG